MPAEHQSTSSKPLTWKGLALLGALGLGGLAVGVARPSAQPEPASKQGPSGSPPALVTDGYVDDGVCAQCHREITESYQTVGMSRAFYPPSAPRQKEDFTNSHVYHAPSQRHYEMVEDDQGGLTLHRYQVGPDGQRRNQVQEEVDWILGSGSNARTYIYQSEWGELFQMPISWYGKTRTWAMAPGYDNPDHQGFQRRVQRDCMFCHNAYPAAVAGSDLPGEPQTFPQELPSGLGCQRCHGPGEEHVRMAFDFSAEPEDIQETIVQPGRLDAKLRDDVCMQCHLQPTVTLSGVRHFDQSMYAFQPGESLDDYLVLMDVVEERSKDERFEINHHPYRLQQSRCFEATPAGELSCLTCHDPHHKKQGDEAKVHYRNVCLSCHEVEACDLPSMMEQTPMAKEVAADNCVACHMPQRRTQDVIEVTLTDHKIRRRPPTGDELVAPIRDVEHRIRDVVFLRPEEAPEGGEGELYRHVARVRAGNTAAVDRLKTALETNPVETVTPYWELAVALLDAGRFAEAEGALRTVLKGWPEHGNAKAHLGIALAAQGKLKAAREQLMAALQHHPELPEAHFNLAKIEVAEGQLAAAAQRFEAALAARPNLDAAWLELGNVRARQERYAEAAQHYRQALVHNPKAQRALHNLVEALLRQGQEASARTELEAWLSFEPDDAQARQRLADLTR